MAQSEIDILIKLSGDGILSSSEAKDTVKMIKERTVKAVHTRAINQRNDGRFITKIKDPDGIKQVGGNTYDELIDKLYDFYFGVLNSSLEDIYPNWRLWRRDECSVTNKTIKENGYLWDAYFKDTAIVKTPLCNLKTKDFISFFRKITKDGTITRKRFNDAKSVLNGIIYYAIEKEIIDHNPLSEINYRQFNYKVENDNVIPYNIFEREAIIKHLADKEDIYSLAIRFDFHMVLRISELKALKWSNIIVDDFIRITGMNVDNQTMNDDMTFNQCTHDFVDRTKGNKRQGKRTLPLTDTAKEILNKVKLLNPDNEFIFLNDGKPLTTCTFNRHLKKCCRELGIPYRSSHKVRFSTASILYKHGVNKTELQGLLGHTSEQMTSHYLRNITDQEDTRKAINSVFG